jgi:hypothetical protein
MCPRFAENHYFFTDTFVDHQFIAPPIASPVSVQILRTAARIQALDLLYRSIYLLLLNCASNMPPKRKATKKATKPPKKPSTSKTASTNTKASGSASNKTKHPAIKPRLVLLELSDDEPDTQPESQALIRPQELNDTQLLPDPVEYGIQFAITYDEKCILDTTKFYTSLDRDVLFELKALEKDAIHDASTKRGRTAHSTRIWQAIVAHAKQRPKPKMLFNTSPEWIELIKLVEIYPVKGRIVVLQIKGKWTRHLPVSSPDSPATSPEKPVKKARFTLQDIPDDVKPIDLTGNPDPMPSTTQKLRVR